MNAVIIFALCVAATVTQPIPPAPTATNGQAGQAQHGHQWKCPTQILSESQCTQIAACMKTAMQGKPKPVMGSEPTQAEKDAFMQQLQECGQQAGVTADQVAQLKALPQPTNGQTGQAGRRHRWICPSGILSKSQCKTIHSCLKTAMQGKPKPAEGGEPTQEEKDAMMQQLQECGKEAGVTADQEAQLKALPKPERPTTASTPAPTPAVNSI